MFHLRYLNFIFLLTVLVRCLVFPVEIDSDLNLRIFPEIANLKIEQLSIAGKNFAVAGGHDFLIRWDGKSWNHFTPPLPLKKYCIDNIRAFSRKNIWVLLKSKSEYQFYTEIFHFSGMQWDKIPSPQAFSLDSFDFIDSTRFFAAGIWGSLIYFDGKTTHNIKCPVNSDLSRLYAFSPDRFYVTLKKKNVDDFSYLYEYNRGKWKVLAKLEGFSYSYHFFSPDSGLIFRQDGVIFEFRDKELIPVDTVNFESGFSFDTVKNCFYTWFDNTIWQYENRKFVKLFESKSPAESYPISENEYFLLRQQKLLYFGNRNIGIAYQPPKIKFEEHFFGYLLDSGHLGVALYPKDSAKVDFYFTNSDGNNNFFTLLEPADQFEFKDVLIERGLAGFNTSFDPRATWDAAAYFADVDNDGDMDAVIAALRGKTRFYENIGNDRFKDVTEDYGINLTGRIKTIEWGDLNNDGDLDFIAGDELGPLRIYLNEGFWRFREITTETGIPDSLEGCQPVLADVDNDGDLDLFLHSNYDHIYYFQHQGIDSAVGIPMFIDKSFLSPDLTTRFDFFPKAMAFGDFDNDGDLDLFCANRVSPSKLFENTGRGIFKDISAEKNLDFNAIAYNANWGDLDQNGYLDLFVTTLGKNYIFWNHQAEYFKIDSTVLPNNDYSYSTGSALEDLDFDGDLDIVIANSQISYSRIYENLLPAKNDLQVSVRGSESNFWGISSKIWLFEEGHPEDSTYLAGYRVISMNSGYCSSGLPVAYFAADPQKRYELFVQFPSGKTVKQGEVMCGENYLIFEPTGAFSHFAYLLQLFKSLFLHKKYRAFVFQFLSVLIILLLFNIYIHIRTYWQLIHLLFWNLSLLSFYLILRWILPESNGWHYRVFPVYLLFISGGLLYFLLNKYSVKRYLHEQQAELFNLVRQFNHGRSGMKQIEHLLFYCNNPDYLLQDSSVQEDLLNEVAYFKNYTVIIARKIFTMARRMRLPKLKLTRKDLNARELSRAANIILRDKVVNQASLNELKTSIEKLKGKTNYIRSAVDVYFSTDLSKILAAVLGKFTEFNEVSTLKPTDLKAVWVVIPQEELLQIFDNLFQNALDAMKDSKTKKITVSIEEPDNGTIQIFVRDFGGGIPQSIQNRIFEPNFSTKNSTGLGLYHVKKWLEQYGGTINLAETKMGKGTNFQIKLRVVHYEQETLADD